MSFAYNTNTAYDYRRYEEQEQVRYEEQTAPKARPVDRAVVMARRVLALSVALLVAALCIGMVYVKAQVFMTQRQINDTQKAIKAAQLANSTLNEQYNEATNINVIMEKAAALGMGYPTGDQILYVSKSSHSAGMEMKNGK